MLGLTLPYRPSAEGDRNLPGLWCDLDPDLDPDLDLDPDFNIDPDLEHDLELNHGPEHDLDQETDFSLAIISAVIIFAPVQNL